ncbi:transketolase family protein [bacterium]|nr:transketolase family protein [bacterium]
MESNRANLVVFSETLANLAKADPSVMVVTSDSRGSAKLVPFGESYPDQLVEVGIAEQNLVGISAGLASTGKKVFAVSPACFLTARSLEQIKNDIAYSNNPVNVIGISGGVSYGALGSTHHSLHDIAVLRAINNIDIILPADNFETQQAILQSAASNHPVYIRFGKKAMQDIHKPNTKFKIGKAIVVCEGEDVAFIATGEAVYPAALAARQLAAQGISSTVVSMHTIKPFDIDVLLQVAKRSRALITVEEHSIFGGLGEACAGYLQEAGVHIPFKRVGIPDEHTVTGNQNEIFEHYGLSENGLAKLAKSLLK